MIAPVVCHTRKAVLEKLERDGLPELTRELSFDRNLIDTDARTVQVVVSTETPVERFFGDEVLVHTPSAVDLTRFNDGAAVLVNHDPDQHVGVVQQGSADVGQKKLRATLRFSKSPEGEKIFNDIRDGIRTKVSVGYRIHSLKLVEESDGDRDVYRADSWTPHEVSVVGIPADVNAKVGRSADANKPQPVTITFSRSMKENQTVDATTTTNQSPNLDAMLEDARREGELKAKADIRNEDARKSEIRSLCELHKLPSDVADKLIAEGRSVDDVKDAILKRLAASNANAPIDLPPLETESRSWAPTTFDTQQGPTKGEQRDLAQFSINAVIRSQMGIETLDGINREMVDEGIREANKAGVQVQGSPIPQICLFNPKRLAEETLGQVRSVSVGVGGGATVATELRGMIDFLRERLQVLNLGAQNLTGLTNNLDWPIMGRGGAISHKAEIAAADEYDWTSTTRPLRPHRIPVQTELSHQLVVQSSIGAEEYTRRTLGFEIASKMDNTALRGDGAGQVPLGILNTPGVNDILSVGGLDWAKIVEFESAVAQENADVGSMAYLTTPGVRGTLKTTAKDPGSGMFLWNDISDSRQGGSMNGYRAEVTTQLSNTAASREMIFGVWSTLIMGQWGGVDIVTDNFSKAEQGLIRVIAWTFYDHILEYAQSFSVSTDIA